MNLDEKIEQIFEKFDYQYKLDILEENNYIQNSVKEFIKRSIIQSVDLTYESIRPEEKAKTVHDSEIERAMVVSRKWTIKELDERYKKFRGRV